MLRDKIIQIIEQDGPMGLDRYMQHCLFDPQFGYYTSQKIFGQQGDFITSPEISQMFGELVGLCLAQAWLSQRCPAPFVFAELGPGRGRLMADILRATRGVPGFHKAMRLHLVEMSPQLQKIQRDTLSVYAPSWHRYFTDMPQAPLFLVANEFFDALPMRQFKRAAQGWCETQVGYDFARSALILGQTPSAPIPALSHRLAGTKLGDIVEMMPQLSVIVHEIGARLEAHGGAALIIDYGNWRSLGDTFQALQRHQMVDPLAAPGQADLTAHVDFEAIAKASPSAATAMVPQGRWLMALGIGARAAALAQSANAAQQEQIFSALKRLTSDDEMGSLFKVIGLHPHAAPPPPGFEHDT